MAGQAGEIRESKTKSTMKSHKLSHMEVRPAENGGAVVTHHYESATRGLADHYKPPDVFAFGKGPEVVHHLMDHLGVKENEMMAHLKGQAKGAAKTKPGGRAESDDEEEASAEKD